jgi:hypothetical protein
MELSSKPELVVVIDTEEEFDWGAPYLRSNTHVTAMRHIGRVQTIFDRFGITPVYVIDYPVAAQPEGYEALLEIHRAGRCEIGGHLHPWVNPPHDESLSVRNSFMMNLPAPLQRQKLQALSDQIGEVFGRRPTTFKAGRYGLGTDTIGLLEEIGYDVDVSVCPQFDFSASDGPSFTMFDSRPFFLTPRLFEIPCTADYTGWAGPLRPALHRLASRDALAPLRAVGVLARLGAVNRIMLSPEGNSFEDMRSLTEALYARGQRTFLLSFHSPSVDTGHTPYVHTHADLEAFLGTIERYCEYFFGQRHGVPVIPRDVRAAVEAPAEPH